MRPTYSSLAVGLCLTAVSLAACGGKPETGTVLASHPDNRHDEPVGDSGTVADGPPAAPEDSGKPIEKNDPSEMYPAFPPDIAQLSNGGGTVLKDPVVVTITWPGEPNATLFEDFGDKIGTSKYWELITKEYGVGPAVSGKDNHVRIATDAPASFSESDLDKLVKDSASDVATSKWPAPTENTLYVLYLPATSKLLLRGTDACAQGIGGYHASTRVSGMEIAYAILPQCKAGKPARVTSASSHEMGEAATDPHTRGKRAFAGFDDDHLAWDLWQHFQTENGDACEFYQDSFYTETEADFAFSVQRQWSNKSASSGGAPCVPAPKEPYFNVTPLALEPIEADLSSFGGSKHTKTKGIHIAVGETRTFDVGFYSDSKTAPWKLTAVESQRASGSPQTPSLDAKVDVTEGQNGQKAHVTVTVNKAWKLNAEVLVLVSDNGKTMRHSMPILIGN
ncbi:MAG: hypothetical protein NVSMB1_24210 [Polyangiales bacterium]